MIFFITKKANIDLQSGLDSLAAEAEAHLEHRNKP